MPTRLEPALNSHTSRLPFSPLFQLPIDEALPQLTSALAQGDNVVLAAPPGSGKTTRVPLALLQQPWLVKQKILMLEPRRLAARTAARYMAASLGERVGGSVGYRVRLDTRISDRTRIEVLTEGVLTRRMQSDPELAGVGLVIFDEFHERSLQADLGLALCLDVQQGLREDLRLLLMSATMDTGAACGLLGKAALVQAEGRSYPVEILYDPAMEDRGLVMDALRGVQRALKEQAGDLLVFLPGVGEIRGLEKRLRERLGPAVQICPLYGDLDATTQDLAIRPDPQGRRRVVLATSIAETSLTIEGVSVVVDTGWSRRSRFDPNNGLNRLVTERVSLAAARQRTGRAGRLGPGVCYRLWAQSLVLNPQHAAEMRNTDLAPLLLELALWGVQDPDDLKWMDSPPPGAVAQARELLQDLEALDGIGRITQLGRRMVGLPLHPRLAHMLLRGAAAGQARRAADLAALLTERDIFRRQSGIIPSRDLDPRLHALETWRTGAHGGSERGLDSAACRRVAKVSEQLLGLVREEQGSHRSMQLSTGALVALAYPERIAQRRSAAGGDYRLANGRGALLDQADVLAGSQLLAVASMDAGVRNGRIYLAASLEQSELEELFSERIENLDQVVWDPQRRAVSAHRERRLDALLLQRHPLARPPAHRVMAALLEGIRGHGLDCLQWTRQAKSLRSRILCLHEWDPDGGWPDLSDGALLAGLEDWLLPWLDGVTSLERLRSLDLEAILRQSMDWERQQTLDELAPERLLVPSGGMRALLYNPGEAPVLAVKLQEMFGLRETPSVYRGRMPVVLHLLSPAGRPLQITRDLGGFWDRTYAQVRKEMKGRYPKHYWPEDPRAAVPTARVRPRSR